MSELQRQRIWDVAIVGGGLAGMTLLRRLMASDLQASVLLFEPAALEEDCRTMAYWAREPTVFDDSGSAQWDQLRVRHDSLDHRMRLGDWDYRMFRPGLFRQAVLERALVSERVERRRQRVVQVEDGTDYAEVSTSDGRWRARWVFDSRFSLEDEPRRKRRVQLRQTFRGCWVETERPTFDPTTATLMDFRAPNRRRDDKRESTGEPSGVEFSYVLPVGPRRAFVERVTMGGGPPAAPGAYLRDVLGLENWRTHSTEGGATPMTDRSFQRRVGDRTLRIGIAGGQLKPSTGYGVRRIDEDARSIVASLERHGHPFDVPKTSRLFGFFDSIMLVVMARFPGRMPRIFGSLFRNNPPARVFRFLDEKASWWDILRIVASLPPLPFLSALFRWTGFRLGLATSVSRQLEP